MGTWPAASSLTTGTLTALSDLHVWLGLKNSDDQGCPVRLSGRTIRLGAPRRLTLIAPIPSR
jgi:hypothetical protein